MKLGFNIRLDAPFFLLEIRKLAQVFGVIVDGVLVQITAI